MGYSKLAVNNAQISFRNGKEQERDFFSLQSVQFYDKYQCIISTVQYAYCLSKKFLNFSSSSCWQTQVHIPIVEEQAPLMD